MKDVAKFLNLSESEQKILTVLEGKKSLRPTDIAKKSSVKRTTANYNLKKLKKRGMVTKKQVGGHFEWSLASVKKIDKKIESAYQFFHQSQKHKEVQISEHVGMEASVGKAALKRAYEELLQLNEGERIYTIEGNNLREQITSLKREYIINLQQKYQDAGIIFEGVIGNSTLESFKDLDPEFLRHHSNRLTVIYVVDDKLTDFDMHILMYKNKVKMVNFAEKLVLSIRNTFIKQSLLSLYRSLKTLGKKVRINKVAEDQLRGGE